MKVVLLLCLLSVYSAQAMPSKEEEQDVEVINRFKRYDEGDEPHPEPGMGDGHHPEPGRGDEPRPEPGMGGNMDVDVNVNINAPNGGVNADVDVGVNINAGGRMPTPSPIQENEICPNCGMRYDTKIIGGQDAAVGAWPWMAYLSYAYDLNDFFCGGSIVTRDTILTASHCVVGIFDSTDIVVTVGTINMPGIPPSAIRCGVVDFIMHDDYDDETLENDIALLKLNCSLDFTRNVQPICLGREDMIYAGRVAYATGWGSLDYDFPAYPDILQEVALHIITNAYCQELYETNSHNITDDMMCALTESKDSCSGDSGGPLVVEDDDDRWYEVGIVSWGQGCALPLTPGVYGRVPYLRDWIYDNIGEIVC